MIQKDGRELVERHLMAQLPEVASYSRVTFLNGPRQAGKTTLLEQLHAVLGGSFQSFDVDRERPPVKTRKATSPPPRARYSSTRSSEVVIHSSSRSRS